MTIFKFLLAIEELLYEILMALFFIPKTLYKIIVSPSKMYQYALDELAHKPDERFNKYMSPLLLFTLLVVIPMSFLAFSPVKPVLENNVIAESLDGNFELKTLAMGGYFLLFPLTIAVFVNWAAKMDMSKSALKPTIYMLCFAFIPPQILDLILCSLILNNPGIDPSLFILAIIPPFWIIWRVALVVKLQTGKEIGPSVGLAFAYYFLMLMILFLLGMIFFYTWELTYGPHARLGATLESIVRYMSS